MNPVGNVTVPNSSFRSPIRRSKTDVIGRQYIRLLGYEYKALIRSNRLGKATVQQVLDFQDRLSTSPSSIKGRIAYKTMQQGSEVLLSYLLSNPQPKTRSTPRRPSVRPSPVHNEQGFSIRPTRGDGACALHSLLGEERNGTYVARSPRKRYVNGLRTALNQKNSAVEERFVGAMTSALNATSDRHSLALFSELSASGRALKSKWNRLNQYEKKAIDQTKSRENAFWIEKLGFSRSIVMEDPDSYIARLSSQDQQQAARNFISTRQVLLNYCDGQKRAFILSKPFVDHYARKAQNSSFYFDTQEIGIAAHIFNKRVEMHSPRGKGETHNPEATEETVTIYHQGAHFSRCIPARTISRGVGGTVTKQRPQTSRRAAPPSLSGRVKSKPFFFRRMLTMIASLFGRVY